MGKKFSKATKQSRSFTPDEAFGVLCDGSLAPTERLAAFDFLRQLYVPSKALEQSYSDDIQRIKSMSFSKLSRPLNCCSSSAAVVSDHVKGLVFGGALGDATGLAAEFLPKSLVLSYYGKDYEFTPACRVYPDSHRVSFTLGDWTDDTDQSLLVLMSLLETAGHASPTNFAQHLVDWRDKGFVGLGDSGGTGMGMSTMAVLSKPTFLSDPLGAADEFWVQTDKKMAANGAIMRTAIIGAVHFHDLGIVKRNTEQICLCTHRDPRCLASCHVVTYIVSRLLCMLADGVPVCDMDIPSLIRDAVKHAEVCYASSEELQELHLYTTDLLTPGKSMNDLHLDDPASIGYTYKCLSCAVLAIYNAYLLVRQDSSSLSSIFAVTVRSIIMQGGDADTNACVAGALVGCYLGHAHLPAQWIDQMPYRRWLDAWALKLLECMND